MTRIRSRSLVIALGGAGALLLFLLGVAHAQAVPPTATPFDWGTALTSVAVALGGVATILGGLSVVLHVIAPRTRTTVDDRLAARVDAAHDKLDEALDVLGRITQPSGDAPKAVTPAPVPSSTAAKAGSVATMALLALAIGGATLAPACHSAGPAVASGIVAAFDCEAANFKPEDLTDATKLAEAEVQHWLASAPAASTDAIKADLAPFKSDLSKCALAGALALATAALGPPSSSSAPGTAVQGLSAAASGADPVQVRAAFSMAARELGWVPVKVAGGTVL